MRFYNCKNNCVRRIFFVVAFQDKTPRKERLVLFMVSELLTDIQFRDDRAVTADILLHQIIEQISSFTNHLQKTSSGMKVLFVNLQMFGQAVDSLGQQCDLHFGRTGVLFMKLVRLNNVRLQFFNHFHSPPYFVHSPEYEAKRRGERLPSHIR